MMETANVPDPKVCFGRATLYQRLFIKDQRKSKRRCATIMELYRDLAFGDIEYSMKYSGGFQERHFVVDSCSKL